jgi:hypothetical protein
MKMEALQSFEMLGTIRPIMCETPEDLNLQWHIMEDEIGRIEMIILHNILVLKPTQKK